MRLLRTDTLEFEEFFDSNIPKYTILSHRWASADQEVSYAEFVTQPFRKQSTSGYAKIFHFAQLSSEQGYQYCWVDTCCIDKRSSAELTECINSMFAWYQKAAVCYAYLADVSGPAQLAESSWWLRGFTLQELLAPRNLEFFDGSWTKLGTKRDLSHDICDITGIPRRLLTGHDSFGGRVRDYSVAQRMSWASRRRTSRTEDVAYCLLGIFNVNMTLRYGEGENSFQRLQLAILEKELDDSLFAWSYSETEQKLQYSSPLARSPADFDGCHDIMSSTSPSSTSSSINFERTNRGMRAIIPRAGNEDVLDKLLRGHGNDFRHQNQGLAIPLQCYVKGERLAYHSLELRLRRDYGKWFSIGVARRMVHLGSVLSSSLVRYPLGFSNDVVHIYISTSQTEQEHSTTEYEGGVDFWHIA